MNLPEISLVHDFQKSLALSHSYSDAPWWLEVYRRAFGSALQACVNVREDGWAQRGGIDRVLTLSSGRTLTVDEKVRAGDWPDILLEVWSDVERKKPGWVQKQLACDFIAYAFIPSRTCYLLPFQTLRRAWFENRNEWQTNYSEIRARNRGYTTVSLPIPIDILMKALADAMIVRWGEEA